MSAGPKRRLTCAAWLWLIASAGCTPVDAPRRLELALSIDADSIVRLSAARVDAVLEGQASAESGGDRVWKTLDQRSLRLEQGADDWPWRYQLSNLGEPLARYSLRAVARDRQGAVVGRVQVERDRAGALQHGLHVHFDTACFRRNPLCDEGLTCSAGNCLDPSVAVDTTPQDAGTSTGADPTSMQTGVASAATSCTEDGSRACSGVASRTPLSCQGGVWQEQPACAEAERCNTQAGPDRGACQPVSEQCKNRTSDQPFCVGDSMYVCKDLIATARLCAENEHCVSGVSAATCECQAGFVSDGQRCVQGTDCGADNGGCDPATHCSMETGARSCSPCPTGYTGSGETGCKPLLIALDVDHGPLAPGFSPTHYDYALQLPLMAQRLRLTPKAPPNTSVTIDGAKVEPGASWTSPPLRLRDTTITVQLTSEHSAASVYTLTAARSGSEEAYIKANNGDDSDQFGFWVSVSGNTLVATAWFEDSNATTVNGDQTNNAATDSGAAYVYVRDGARWMPQAYLKASDASANSYFGVRAVVQGDMIVVGALGEGIYTPRSAAVRSGAAYVFERRDGQWRQTQRLAAEGASGANLFGSAIAIDGDRMAIGAAWESTSESRSGAVYIFERVSGEWKQRQMLKSSKPHPDALFGSAVALLGDQLVVGAPNDSEPATNTGSAEIFVQKPDGWHSQLWLQPATLTAGANFGFSTALYEDRIAIGAPHTKPFLSTDDTPPGEVYLLQKRPDGWGASGLITAPTQHRSDFYGINVLLGAGTLAVAACGDPSGSTGLNGDPTRTDAKFSGAAYLYADVGNEWIQSAYIKPHNTSPDDAFGYALAMDGTTLAVGATLESGTARGVNGDGTSSGSLTSGAVYVFH